MISHVPDPIELIDYMEDGEQARHYRFRLQSQSQRHDWQSAEPGQFFMLNVPSVGEAPFTFTAPPNERGEFRAFIRQMGTATRALFSMVPGQILGARGPFGRGWPVSEIINKNTLIIAGGCGLAPLVNLIDQLLSRSNEQQLVLIYGARNKQSQMLTPERARWQDTIQIFNTLDDIQGSDESSAAIQGTPLDVLPQALASFDSPATKALLCGPEDMMTVLASRLVKQGLTAEDIYLSIERRMHCAVGLCGHCYLGSQYACKTGPTFSWSKLQPMIQDGANPVATT